MDKQKNNKGSHCSWNFYMGIFLLSAATLLFEINLTRLYSIAQFYHFAFFIVSLALLGFGTSGSILSLFPQLAKGDISKKFQWLSLSTAISLLSSYLIFITVPFDSFAIAVKPGQILILVLHYVFLSLPFFFSGLVVGIFLNAFPQKVNKIYAANLLGSSMGCMLAFFTPSLVGGVGVVMLCMGIAALALFISAVHRWWISIGSQSKLVFQLGLILIALLLVSFSSLECRRYIQEGSVSQWLNLHISPYKGLSYALQYPHATISSTSWNAFSRMDIVESQGLRSIPGLSYRYPEVINVKKGIFIDGDNLNVLIDPQDNLEFTEYLPQFIAYRLKSTPKVLVLEPYGGLDIAVALAGNSREITAVEPNNLILQTIEPLYEDYGIHFINENMRSFLRRNKGMFDIAVLSLTSSYHPVNSGAYSLTEDYRYTVEAFLEVIDHLDEGGIFVVNRWLQMPSSEWLRAFSTAITAMEKSDIDVKNCIVAFRGYNLGTLLIKKQPFTEQELQTIRIFLSDYSFDLVYSTDVKEDEINTNNILQEPIYYQAFTDLIKMDDKSAFYTGYPFNVAPPGDNHPFFSHYFKWSQLPSIIEGYGKTWQPFGGAGYLVMFVLLLITMLVSITLIIVPLLFKRLEFKYIHAKYKDLVQMVFFYFFLLGLAFMLVEIPLIQKFILFLGHPAYAFSTVLFSLLLFSGLGSSFSKNLPVRLIILLLVAYLCVLPLIFSKGIDVAIGFSLPSRILITIVMLSPLGFLMGIPFPAGMYALGRKMPSLIPWAWGINGATSVVASVLAAFLAIETGFNVVLLIGALCYFGVWLIIPRVFA
jgi:hypothetical protein